MKILTAYFDQPAAPATLRKRCFRAVLMVASVWTLLGAGLQMWGLELAKDSALYVKVRIFSIGSLLVAAGIYSVLLPLYYILRDDSGQAS